jgi:hypothetical protein
MGQRAGFFTNFSFLYDFFYIAFFLSSVKLSKSHSPLAHFSPFYSIIFTTTTKLNI